MRTSKSNLILNLQQRCKSRAQIQQVHAHAITTGLFSLYPSPLLSRILRCFISRRTTAPSDYDIIYISKIFSLMPNPSNSDYNNIIKTHTLLHSPRTAVILFIEMRRRPTAPDSRTFNFVLGACGLLRNSHSLAKALHAQLTKFGFLDDVCVRSSLCCTYGRSGDVDGAKGVFEGSSFKDVVCYNVMIDAFFKAGEFDSARELFDEMPHSFRDVVSYNSMIDGLVKAGDIHRAWELFYEMSISFRNVVSYTALIDGLFKAGEFDRARDLFDEMPRSFRNVVSYNAMIDGLFKARDIHRARELFKEMPILFRNVVSYTAMIDGLFKAGEFGQAKELFGEMPHSFKNTVSYTAMIHGLFKAGDIYSARDLFDEMPISYRDVGSYNAMIGGLSKAGDIDRAKELFDEMPISLRNVVSYNAMLMGLAKHGHGGSVLEQYLSRMLEGGVKPDGGTILAVLVGYSHSGLINDAKRIFVEMESVYSVPREIQHYGCMADVLARAGLIKEAREMIQKMPMKGDAYVWGPLLGGCKIHGDVEVAEEAAKHLLQANPKDGRVYSALAHNYSNLGQWDDVVNVRRLRDRQEFAAKSNIIK